MDVSDVRIVPTEGSSAPAPRALGIDVIAGEQQAGETNR